MRTFDPWIGAHYRTEGVSGVRVLILGESHYGDAGKETPSCTTDVVREWGQEKRHRFFTVTQKLVLGLGPGWISSEKRAEFWEHVAFYNFVQRFVGPGARYRPSEDMWQAAAKPFLATLTELQPQLLIVLGFALRSRLPAVPTGINVCNVQHPSSAGFRCKDWQPVIATGFAAIKEASADPTATHGHGAADETISAPGHPVETGS